jgi:putative transposase
MSREAHVRLCESVEVRLRCATRPVTETFFKTLKTELVYDEYYRTQKEARHSMFEFIEVFYNRQRKHSFLGYKSPVDFLLNKQQPIGMAS